MHYACLEVGHCSYYSVRHGICLSRKPINWGLGMDGFWNVLMITSAAILTAILVVIVPEIISRRMIQTRIKRATEALDAVTAAMEEFQDALGHMSRAVSDFTRAMDESGLTRLTVEHFEKEIEDGSTRPSGERGTGK